MSNNKNPVILIVDDEEVNRLIIRRSFSPDEFNIHEAKSGEEALHLLEKITPDIILLDIMMPGVDGYTVCQQVRLNPKTFDIPIIIVTALSDKESQMKGLRLGANDVLSKPFDIFEIRLRVGQLLRMRELYMTLRRQNDSIKKDIMAARKIQMNLLPNHRIELAPNCEFFYEYFPCESLGGDFVDIIHIDNNRYLFYIADVSGHGVASSLVTIFIKEFFNQNLKRIISHCSPSRIFVDLNQAILNMNFAERYLTMFLAIIDLDTYTMKWSSAGPNTMPILFTNHNKTVLENQALAIGWMNEATWVDYDLTIPKDSLLICYSDAAVEIKNPEEVALGIDGFETMLYDSDLYENMDFEIIIQKLLDYSQRIDFIDDLTLVGIHF